MSKIVIDARESGSSTGRYIDKLIENLAQLPTDHVFTLLTKPHRVTYLKQIAPNFTVVVSKHKEFTVGEQTGLMKQIKSLGPDLVHYGMTQQPVLYRGKVITTIHDLTTTWVKNPARNPIVHKAKQQVYKTVIKKATKKSIAVITPSDFVKQDLIKFTGESPKKFFVTYEAADHIEDEAVALPDLVNKQFIMYVGRPTPHKNLESLIEAFSKLRENHPDLMLVLAGKKEPNYIRIKDIVRAKGLENVVFTNFISEGQLRWLYQNCAAYIFPSLSEGFGLPGLEAMVHGAPVLSSIATCLPEIYGDAANYFNPLDIDEMANVIAEVLGNQTLRDDLIKRGHIQAAKYSWRRMAEQTLAIYDKALKS